jgi:hypothetical protein
MFCVLFNPASQKLSLDGYKQIWTTIQTSPDMCFVIQNLNKKFQSSQGIISRLESNYSSLVHRLENNSQGKNSELSQTNYSFQLHLQMEFLA